MVRTDPCGFRVLVVLLWTLAGLLRPTPAQQDPVVTCRVCNSNGKVPCSKHGRLWAQEQLAAGTVLCSAIADCKQCSGALAVDCKSCRNQPVETDILQRQKLAREWLAKRREKVDTLLDGDPLWHLDTPHFDLVFGIRPTTVGKEKLDTHPLMHLYGQRLEALRTLFLKTFELREEDQKTRIQVYMFRNGKDQSLIGPRVTGIGTSQATGTKLMGVDAVYSMWQDLRAFPDDEALHRGIVHNVTHLLLCNATPSQVLYNKKAGWIDEGVAHWFEDKLTGKCTNFCFEEILMMPGASFKGGRWRAPVRKMVDEGKLRTFAELSTLNTDQLDFPDHAISFALVDFLLTVHGGAKFRDLVRLVKQDKPQREALQTVYGLNPLTIDAPFQQWVKDNYSPLDVR